jgi:hypothetical protein
MAADSLQKTAGTARRQGGPGRPFQKGQSGNPAGRRRGSKNRGTLAAQLFLDGEAEGLARRAVAMALGGDALLMRACLDRIVAPRRGRAVQIELPPVDNAEALAGAMGVVAAAVAAGEISPEEGAEFAQIVDVFARTIATRDLARRVSELENAYAAQS